MVLFMGLELFTDCMFSVFNILTNTNNFFGKHLILEYILAKFAVLFQLIACTINTRNWVHFYIRISEAANMNKI